MEGFSEKWDEMKEQLEKAIELKKDKDNLTITIKILESNVEDNEMVGGMLKGEDEMKQSLGQFLGEKEPLNCEIDIDEEEKQITMKFENKKEFKKVYELLHDMFFGDFFKKMLEAMFGAFGNMFKQDLDPPF